MTYEVYDDHHDNTYLLVYDGQECIYASLVDGEELAESIRAINNGVDPRVDDWNASLPHGLVGRLFHLASGIVLRKQTNLRHGSMACNMAADILEASK